MRILQVRFNNLNSLTGEWSLDFTDPEYLANGIFAITGPTGAGKSTILDAICLALYAETPRLGKITKSSNEIMARQTGECFSEVEFETARGRFRCHFSQRRAYGKADGELQHQKHEIVDVYSGQPLETKLRQVVAMVTEVTGMDFDRFTRSILLAQGEFSKFLLARASERAPILEKITGTEIYSRISIKVHEQTSVERKKMEHLKGELEATQLLSKEERVLFEADLKRSDELVVALCREINALICSLTWLENISKLERDIVILAKAGQDFVKRKAEQTPLLLKLAKAEKAGSLEAEYVKLSALRQQQKGETVQLGGKRKHLQAVAESLKGAAESLRGREAGVSRVNGAKQQEAALIIKVRALDTRLVDGRKSLKTLVAELQDDGKKRGTLQAEISRVESNISGHEKEVAVIDAYLAQHKIDESLVENLEGVRHLVHNAVGLDEKNNQAVKTLASATVSVGEIAQCLGEKEKTWRVDQEQVDALKNSLKKNQDEIRELLGARLLSDLRQEVDGLEQRLRDYRELSISLAKVDKIRLDLVTLQGEDADLQKRKADLLVDESSFAEKENSSAEIVRHLSEKRDLVHQVLSLEEHRLRLADDKPCPLCGALEHPYAKGNIPQLADVEQELSAAQTVLHALKGERSTCKLQLVTVDKDLEQCAKEVRVLSSLREQEDKKVTAFSETLQVPVSADNRSAGLGAEFTKTGELAEQLKAKLVLVEKKLQEEQSLQHSLSAGRDKLDKSGKARDAAKNRHKSQLEEQRRLTREGEILLHDLDAALAVVGEHLKLFAVKKFSTQESGKVLASLDQRRDAWKENRAGKERIAGQVVSLVNDKKTTVLLYEKLGVDLGRKRRKLQTFSLALHALAKERQELYDCKDPAREERRLAAELVAAEDACDTLKIQVSDLDKQQHGLQVEIAALSKSTTNRLLEISQLEEQWVGSLQGASFSNEAAFLEIRLDNGELHRLIALRENIDKEGIELSFQQADRKDNLQKEKKKQVTERSYEELQQQKKGKDEELQQVNQRIGEIKGRLELDGKNRRQQQEKIQALESQKKEFERWEHLHYLIGSSDGKKFRMFAQGLTFEMMIAHANHKLQEMSDRYILIRDDEQPLELGVIDNYQAGEIRSTKNLSGGESFIVSLALALGLSNMASRNVRVDSLFLDEGFGTLDEDALETALETLSGLHQEGKLIGVISHVSALKERIAAQIQVVPGTGGRSRLFGPGCVSLSSS